MSRFLLDTNMLLGFIRGAEWANGAREKYRLSDSDTTTMTSIICHGEILALAEKNGWGSAKRKKLDAVLNGFLAVDINHPHILEAYAQIYTWTRGKKVVSQPVAPPQPARPMAQNDMWIAATAHVTKVTLLSTNYKDFKHLDKIWFPFVYIDQESHTAMNPTPPATPREN